MRNALTINGHWPELGADSQSKTSFVKEIGHVAA